MALTFYYGSGSPYSWRVYLALEHKQAPYELRTLSFEKGEHRTSEFAALNPRHQVPTIDDDGFALFESPAIVEYLEERFPERPLFPRDLRARAVARRMVAEVDAYVMPRGEVFVEELFFNREPRDADVRRLDAAKAALIEELERFQSYLQGDWFFEQPTAVDYAFYPALAMLPRYERRLPELALAASVPVKLKAWMQRVEALPFFDKTYPPHWR